VSWIVAHGIGTALIEPRQAWQKGVTEKFRDECLSLEWFPSRAEAKVTIEGWRRHNEVRPHSSLNHLTPNEFVARGARPAPRQATGRRLRFMGTPRPGPLRGHPVGTRAASDGSHLANPWSEEPGQVTICQFSDHIHSLDRRK
jgi:putative transposase